MPADPIARGLSVLKAAWIDDLVVEGATRNVPQSEMPPQEPDGERTVPVLVTRFDVRGELQALVDGQITERVDFEEQRDDFREQLRRDREARIAAAQAGATP